MNSDSFNILYVEDNEDLRQLGELRLEQEGHNVDTASSGEEALEILEQNDYGYDAIASDFEMEELTGADLLQQVRERGYEKPFWIYTNREQSHVDEDSDLQIGWTPCSEEYLSKSEGYGQLAENLTSCMLETGTN